MGRLIQIGILFCLSGNLYAQSSTVDLLFIGDIMQHGEQLKSAQNKQLKGYDYRPNYRYISHLIKGADLAIGNLELTLAGPPYSGYPAFSAPDDLAIALKDAGLDFLVTANNHSLDRSKKGLERTIETLDRLEIPHTGTFKDSTEKAMNYPALIEKNGFRIALLNYTYGTNGIAVREPNIVNYIKTDDIISDLQRSRELSPDVIIVFTHWGREYKSLPSSDQKELTELLFQNGANLVIGSHPHVIQPVMMRSDSQLVAYSLGNFISNQRKRLTDGGMMLRVELEKTGDTVRIKRAGYHLSWVYTTAAPNKQFHVVPAASYAYDSSFFHHTASLTKMNLFLSDSRNLLAKYNRGVTELRTYPPLLNPEFRMSIGNTVEPVRVKVITKPSSPEIAAVREMTKKVVARPPKENFSAKSGAFSIQLLASSSADAVLDLPPSYLKQLRVENENGLYKYKIGNWRSREEAEKQLAEIRLFKEFSDAFIVVKSRGK